MPTLRSRSRALYLDFLQRRASQFPPLHAGSRVLIVAPHPDDETLGCGGVIARAAAASANVQVVVMTDGGLYPVSPDRASVARVRRAETLAAMAVLGVPSDCVTFFDFPDGELEQHRRAAAQRLSELLRSASPQQIFVPYIKDRHPDHVATARIVRAAYAAAGTDADLYEYPIWFFAFWPLIGVVPQFSGSRARDRLAALRRSIVSSIRLFTRFRTILSLEADDVRRKTSAVACYRSQTAAGGAGPATLADFDDGAFLELLTGKQEYFCRVRSMRKKPAGA
jgi:LmbE family N-acetylglucosaminyl deacetylase